jgi:phosphoribosylamine---glycine ligase
MKVLVVGSGAREHVLSWCAARSPRVEAVVTAPGNPGTAALGENVPVDPLDLPALVEVARRVAPDLAIVGSDDPLAAGAVDALQSAGVRAFGPTRAAAEIESSKVWSKGFMRRHGVPTAPFEVFGDAGAAHRFLDQNPWEGRLVVKADGLTRGKGVLVPDSLAEAHDALAAVMEQRAFGPGGDRVVIERRLEGPEASVFALCDGDPLRRSARPQAHLRRRPRPQHGGHGRLFAHPPRPPAAAGGGDGPRRPPDGGRTGRRGAPV